MASGPCLRRCRVVRRYMPIRLPFYRLDVKSYPSIHVSMYFESFWEGNAVNTGVPCLKVPMHRKLRPDGHVSRIWYNSCRHRVCPQCAYLQTERRLARQQARLLACDHYHVIFTLPHALNPLWLANVSGMTTLLFQAVHDTLRTLLADPKYLGAQPGIIAALHTWSQTLVLHPHVHCLVTGGGVTPDGHWQA